MNTSSSLCDFMRISRKNAGLSQSAIAEKLNMSHQAYAYIESGQHSFNGEYVKPFCDAVDVSYSDMLDVMYPFAGIGVGRISDINVYAENVAAHCTCDIIRAMHLSANTWQADMIANPKTFYDVITAMNGFSHEEDKIRVSGLFNAFKDASSFLSLLQFLSILFSNNSVFASEVKLLFKKASHNGDTDLYADRLIKKLCECQLCDPDLIDLSELYMQPYISDILFSNSDVFCKKNWLQNKGIKFDMIVAMGYVPVHTALSRLVIMNSKSEQRWGNLIFEALMRK